MIVSRLYIDTSVIGGCYDDEFARESTMLINEFRKAYAIAVVSALTLKELEYAPRAVREILTGIPDGAIEYVDLDENASSLADAYIAEGIVGPGYLADAQHVAIATIQKVDVIVSWNFKHIVNLNRIRLFTAVNLRHGLMTPEIRSPKEVLVQNEDEEGI